MRYRKLDANGDYMLGHGQADFFTDTPEAPAQAVLTRLKLDLAAWFLDLTDGTAWNTQVLGNNTQSTRDTVIRDRILATQGVNSIVQYSSSYDAPTRRFNVSVQIDTIYGVFPPTVPGSGSGLPSSGALSISMPA